MLVLVLVLLIMRKYGLIMIIHGLNLIKYVLILRKDFGFGIVVVCAYVKEAK